MMICCASATYGYFDFIRRATARAVSLLRFDVAADAAADASRAGAYGLLFQRAMPAAPAIRCHTMMLRRC